MVLKKPNPHKSAAEAEVVFRRRLLTWYRTHKRDLPWRADRDPYRVWLSEIMLQQTRVGAVLDHYRRFLQRFPTVGKLARARESSVLAAWSGLGYYRRARMLHAAAKKVVRDHAGKFPDTVEGLWALPGVGRYTAAAIASIAIDRPAAVVDGNVARVLRRLLGNGLQGEKLWQEAERLLDRNHPGDFNQALMELGATVCLPRQPLCLACPLVELCATRGESPGTKRDGRQNKREVAYLLDCRNGSVFLVRRPEDASLMPGMWELPEVPDQTGSRDPWLTLRHSITVTDYTVRVLRGPSPRGRSGRWVSRDRVNQLPLTGLARKVLRAANII